MQTVEKEDQIQMEPKPGFLEPKEKKLADNTSDNKNTRDTGHPQQSSDQSPMPEPQKDAEFWPLSTKPFFCLVLKPQHLGRLVIPGKFYKNLPTAKVPAKIIYLGKAWDLDYLGNETSNKRFESEAWGKFVKDNALKSGDLCVFELIEGSSDSSSIKFRVQILKEDFPSELLENAPGYRVNNPISLD